MPHTSGSDDTISRIFEDFRLDEYYAPIVYGSTQEHAPDSGGYHFPLGGSSVPLPTTPPPLPPKR